MGYDLENRMRSWTSGSTTETYAYDGDGNRRQRSVGGSVTNNYFWDTRTAVPELALEQNGSNALIRRYVYGSGLTPLTMTNTTDTYGYSTDNMGSVIDVTDHTGAVAETFGYDPYGNARGTVPTSPANPVRFTGQYDEFNNTNLYNLRARVYDPGVSRFLEQDPLSASLLQPDIASYSYVADSPVVSADPSGQCPAVISLFPFSLIWHGIRAVWDYAHCGNAWSQWDAFKAPFVAFFNAHNNRVTDTGVGSYISEKQAWDILKESTYAQNLLKYCGGAAAATAAGL